MNNLLLVLIFKWNEKKKIKNNRIQVCNMQVNEK